MTSSWTETSSYQIKLKYVAALNKYSITTLSKLKKICNHSKSLAKKLLNNKMTHKAWRVTLRLKWLMVSLFNYGIITNMNSWIDSLAKESNNSNNPLTFDPFSNPVKSSHNSSKAFNNRELLQIDKLIRNPGKCISNNKSKFILLSY